GRTHWTLWKHFLSREAVIRWIRIDEAPNRSVFRRDLGFDATPGMSVLSDDNCPFNGNSQPLQFLIVLRNSIIDEHQRTRHVAVSRVGVIGGQLLGLLV